jgi:transposase
MSAVSGVTTRPGAGEAAVMRRRLAGAEAEVALLRRQVALSGDRVAEVEADNARLTAQVERLQARLEAARRAGKRQAAPFSRDAKKSDPKRPGRAPGGGYGVKARRERPAPERVDESVAVGLPVCCPDCDGDVVFDKVEPQFQEEFVPARSRMRRYEVALGHCAGCKRRVRGRHPEQTSDALGAAGVMLGPRAHALAAWLHVGLGVPMAKVAKILAALGGISVTPGGLHQALHRTAGDADATYQALLTALRGSGAVAADETGWRIDGDRAWLWVYVGDTVTVYDIAAGRGYRDAEAILGEGFAGVLERDGWAPYRRFEHATHQTCLAHLLRRCSELIGDAVAGQAKVPHALRRILLDALAVRDQQLTGAAVADRVAGLQARIDRFCARTPTHDPNRRLVGHVARERDHLLTFLTHDGVAATNWRAEQALRGMICNRKQWGGNKTRAGADTAAVIASVLRTADQQHVDPVEVLADIQRTRGVPDRLDLVTVDGGGGRSP